MTRFTSLKEAVSDNLADGASVAFEGFTHLIPHAAAHEAIRQGRRDLVLIRMNPDIVYDRGEVAYAPGCGETAPPTAEELHLLRALKARTAVALGGAADGAC